MRPATETCERRAEGGRDGAPGVSDWVLRGLRSGGCAHRDVAKARAGLVAERVVLLEEDGHADRHVELVRVRVGVLRLAQGLDRRRARLVVLLLGGRGGAGRRAGGSGRWGQLGEQLQRDPRGRQRRTWGSSVASSSALGFFEAAAGGAAAAFSALLAAFARSLIRALSLLLGRRKDRASAGEEGVSARYPAAASASLLCERTTWRPSRR